MLLSLFGLASKSNPYSTYFWIMKARKGQNLHSSHCANKNIKKSAYHTISPWLQMQGWSLSSCVLARGLYRELQSLATLTPSSFFESWSTMTNVANIVPRQSAIPEQKVSDWAPFALTCPLTTFHSLVSGLTATYIFRPLIEGRKLHWSKIRSFQVISLTKSYRFCTLLVLKLKYSRQKQVKYQEPHISTAIISK